VYSSLLCSPGNLGEGGIFSTPSPNKTLVCSISSQWD